MTFLIHSDKRYLSLGLVLAGGMFFGGQLSAQTNSPAQILAQMDQCREQVISHLSLSDKMKFRSTIGGIQKNPQFIAANNAVTNAATPQDEVEARKMLGNLKLDLIEQQDPTLKPVVEQIRAAQAALLK